MLIQEFERNKHIYCNNAFVELVRDAVRFFNGTPVHTLPLSMNFQGAGVYSLYYIGDNPIYEKYKYLNRLSYDYPIYVGKAVPKGWRQARISDSMATRSDELCKRLGEHSKSIKQSDNLEPTDFACRFVIFESESSDMIGTIEAALIKLNQPLWNSCLDGFGNHDPGSGRYEQAKSDWDVLHSGRTWAGRLHGTPKSKEVIIANVTQYLAGLRRILL